MLAEVIANHEQDLLSEWVSLQLAELAAGRRSVDDRQMREQSRNFLSAFKSAMAATNGESIAGSEWNSVREVLERVSNARLNQGFTPSEVATFVFSFKQAASEPRTPRVFPGRKSTSPRTSITPTITFSRRCNNAAGTAACTRILELNTVTKMAVLNSCKAVDVLGAGGIGVALAWTLEGAGCEVNVIDADTRKVEWGRREGLTVEGRETRHPRFTAFSEWKPADDRLILLCTKTYDNPAVLQRLHERLFD